MSNSLPFHGPRGTYTRGYLPHFDHAGLVHFVTFCLADALPATVGGLDPGEGDEQLDRGHGACVLQRPDAAGVVRAAIHHFDGERYRLGPWVIMPNHVHLLVRPRATHGLGEIVHSWKSFTAKRINALLGCDGQLWQREYFDRHIRNRRHLLAAARYTHENPVTAGLVARAEDWPFSSARDPAYLAAVLGAEG